MKTLKTLLVLLFVTTLLLSACAKAEPILNATGAVASEKGWTADQLKKLDTITADYTNKDGETTSYTGAPLAKLLEEAEVNADATTLVFVASDGYTAEATLEEVKACANCLVAFDDDGSLRMVMPDFSSKLQVKGVVEFQFK